MPRKRKSTVCQHCNGPSYSGSRCRLCKRLGITLTMAEYMQLMHLLPGEPLPAWFWASVDYVCPDLMGRIDVVRLTLEVSAADRQR